MDSAVAVGLVVEGSRPWSWRFTHALVQEVLVGDLSALRRARLHARIGEALERRIAGATDDAAGRAARPPLRRGAAGGRARTRARLYSTAAARAARARLAHGEAAAHTRQALELLDPLSPTPPAPGTTCSPRWATTCCAAAQLTEARGVVGRGDQRWPASSTTGSAWPSPRPSGAASRCGTGARTAWSTTTWWALLEDLLSERGDDDDPTTARLLGTLGVELAFGPDDRGVQAAQRAVEMARRIGDPELLGRTLNNFSLAVWGRPGAAELRLAAADESLALVGRGLPRRTEFMAHLHRAAIRLHLGDLAGFEADHDEARRMAVSLSGPEVRPHVLWQAGGLAWLRGNAARAEELTTEAYELFRRVTPHARHAYAAHQFTLRRADHRAGRRAAAAGRDRRRGQPAAAGDGGAGGGRVRRRRRGPAAARPLGADAGPRLGQRRRRATCRRRARCGWATSRTGPAAAESLLPYRGRQAVLGTPSLTPGRLRRAARPDRRAPRGHRRRPALVGRRRASRACWSARRTRWRWPSRTSPACPRRPRPRWWDHGRNAPLSRRPAPAVTPEEPRRLPPHLDPRRAPAPREPRRPTGGPPRGPGDGSGRGSGQGRDGVLRGRRRWRARWRRCSAGCCCSAAGGGGTWSASPRPACSAPTPSPPRATRTPAMPVTP